MSRRDIPPDGAGHSIDLKGIVDANIDPMLVIDRDGRIRCANRAAERLLGRDLAMLTGAPFGVSASVGATTRVEVLDPAGDTAVIEMRIADTDIEVFDPTGTAAAVEMRVADAAWEGEPVQLVSMRDITDRKQAEAALRESEERFRTSVENMLDAFAIFSAARDESGRIVDFVYEYVNDAGCAAGMTTREKVVGHRLLDIGPSHHGRLFHDYCRVVETGRALSRDALAHKDTSRGEQTPSRTFDVRAVKLGDGFAVAWRDITARKRNDEALEAAHAELQRQRLYLRGLIEAAIDALVTVDADLVVTDVNDQMCRMAGRSRSELIGSRFDSYFTDPQAAAAGVARTLDSGAVTDYELCLAGADAPSKIVSFNAARFTDATGHRGVFAAAHDITEAKRAEEALGAAHAALERHSAELGRSNRELEQFAYVASHDLQAPLRTVHGFAELIAEHTAAADAQIRTYVEHVLDGTERMRQLIQDLLHFSRVGTHGADFVATDADAVLAHVQESLRSVIAETGAVITHDPLPTVTADPRQFEQLLQNLIDNAIKYRSDDPPRIHIGVERAGTVWRFAVTDNGIGIDPRFSERIFQVFQRLHPRDTSHGTGIGLSICQKIIERHGGTITVNSTPGNGATFTFTIPD